MCLSDEVYEWLVYSGSEHVKIGKYSVNKNALFEFYCMCKYGLLVHTASLPGMWERTITVGSAGKTFHATGWKVHVWVGLGWLLAVDVGICV